MVTTFYNISNVRSNHQQQQPAAIIIITLLTWFTCLYDHRLHHLHPLPLYILGLLHTFTCIWVKSLSPSIHPCCLPATNDSDVYLRFSLIFLFVCAFCCCTYFLQRFSSHSQGFSFNLTFLGSACWLCY